LVLPLTGGMGRRRAFPFPSIPYWYARAHFEDWITFLLTEWIPHYYALSFTKKREEEPFPLTLAYRTLHFFPSKRPTHYCIFIKDGTPEFILPSPSLMYICIFNTAFLIRYRSIDTRVQQWVGNHTESKKPWTKMHPFTHSIFHKSFDNEAPSFSPLLLPIY
jgi:hypothetical protein